jgi:hypothetical protein
MHLKHKLTSLFVICFSLNIFSYSEDFTSNGDVQIAYRDYGPAEGEPILLVTGLGAQLTLPMIIEMLAYHPALPLSPLS